MGNNCTLYNDTEYDVSIHDYDGRRILRPGCSERNGLAKGGNYYINLTMKFPYPYSDQTKRLYGREYNETHYMSTMFRDRIRQIKEEKEREERQRREEKERRERIERQRREREERERRKRE